MIEGNPVLNGCFLGIKPPLQTLTVTPTHGRRHIKQQNILLAAVNQVTLNCFPLATGWNVQGANPGVCKRYSVLHLMSRPDLGCTQSHVLGLLPGAGIDQPRQSSAEVKNEWRYTLTPSLCILWQVME